MITHIKIQNFRSFVEAEVDLQPFSLVVGANGSGKTTLLKCLAIALAPGFSWAKWQPHLTLHTDRRSFKFSDKNGKLYSGATDGAGSASPTSRRQWNFEVTIFNLDADAISNAEQIVPSPRISADGSGTVQVLDNLKNGDREDLFDNIEIEFQRCVPEIEKLSLKTVQEGLKQIQVREKGLPHSLPAKELSEGTRIILALLTIIHQESPPSMILLEDIDRGLHPRLFEYMAPLLRDIAVRHDINIVATTHNPYLVDAMQDHKDAVIIVEKKDGASTLTTLASRLEGLDYDKVDPDDLPLGQLWFSGLVGGVPKTIANRSST